MTRAHYQMELQSVRQHLLEMGDTTVAVLSEALRAIVDPQPETLRRASELESQTDHQHRMIHDECLEVITRQAPVAGDARLLTAVLNAIVDLELIADYAYEIAALTGSERKRAPSGILAQISAIGSKVRDALIAAVQSWRLEPGVRAATGLRDTPIRAECAALYEKLSQLTAGPGDATTYVDLMLVSKHFERIWRHAVFVAEQAAEAAPRERSEAR